MAYITVDDSFVGQSLAGMRRAGGTPARSASHLLSAVALVLGVLGIHALASESCGLPMGHATSSQHIGIAPAPSRECVLPDPRYVYTPWGYMEGAEP